MIGLLLNDGQTIMDDVLIPLGIFAPQGTDIAFDQGNRSLEFVADDGNKSILDLFCVAEFGDVADRGDDISQSSITCKQWRIGYADWQIRRFRTRQVTFNVQVSVGG